MNLLSPFLEGKNVGSELRVSDNLAEMASNSQQKMSEYFTSLEFTARKRYLEKLKIDGRELDDPFGIDEDQWSEDLTQWPELEFGDLYTYLIDSEGVYTKEKLKAYKSLDSYNYYHNGYVRTVYHFAADEWSILKARVNPSQCSADHNHEAWVIINTQNGAVRTGHCKCKAEYVSCFRHAS